ncbi:5-formyltetrahydrofolate cyclo-ligase [Solimonas fluminis]|uniref:5-formyltetrahydrofolate cyclo-ligase n=1 Tax=Solimonas fluminis TaxID=2086571 RepID=A0A2S5TK56_9GAMM|nr:5-formyltetrahydrofolate cyclo-ligase [Solimonas fluminis]PPE75380.1 5-formyltetrahydrofolate cyclo-ligase [Solimonas fluminis]
MRREFRRLRRTLGPAQRRRAAARAAARFARSLLFRRARQLALYLAHGSELDTLPLLHRCHAAGKAVYVPRVLDGHRMRFERYAPGTRLRRNRYGILEPAIRGARRGPMRLDLVVVPLTAFDARGHRLGAGGGYYDRAFAGRRGSRPRLVGYAYALQQAPALPAEPWDVRLDAVVTDKTLFVFRS